MFLEKRSVVAMTLVFAFGSTIALTGCKEQGPSQSTQQMPPTEVSVFKVTLGEHVLDTVLTGRAHAYREAVVRPQVNGVLLKRLYTEGAEVKKGQPLYLIDPAPDQSVLASAEAQVAQAKATLTKAQADAKRSSELLKTKAVSKQADDAAQAAYRQAQATLKAAEAAVSTARINLTYTKVLSPIDGVTSRSEFTECALMTSYQSAPLTTVQQRDPMYVDVVQPAQNVLKMKQELASGQLKTDSNGNAKVKLQLPDGSVYAHEGTLTFHGVTVDEATGSVNLRMEFPNPDHLLMPGLFVKAKLVQGGIPNSALVSMQAVMHDPKGRSYVYVVDKDNKIEQRFIEVAGSDGTSWLVKGGLKDGERVVYDGFLRIAPGRQVTPKEGDPSTLQNHPNPLF